ncbi:hypothetical protein TB2_014120 [Malus domestica]
MEAVPIPTETYKLGFVGAGKMAESIARGIVRSGVLPPNRIATFHPDASRRQSFESFGVHLLSKNDDVVEESDVVIFSVKPQVVKDVVLQLRPLLSRKKLLVSIAAGVKLKDLQVSHLQLFVLLSTLTVWIGQKHSLLKGIRKENEIIF